MRLGPTPLIRCATASAVALLLVSGCGTGAGDDLARDPGATTSSAAPDGIPACATIWVDGHTLPRGYRGCFQDGATVEPTRHRCEFGVMIVEFDKRFYAVPGKRVNETAGLASSAQFRNALRSCQG